MAEAEDDARYPPNPYTPNHRRPFPSLHRSKLPVGDSSFPTSGGHNYAADDDEDDEDEQNDIDHTMNEAEAEDDDDDEEDDDDDAGGCCRIRDDDGSSESLRKRRKLDKFALGFEFAPRVAAAAPSMKQSPARNSPPDWSEDSTFVLLDAWGDLYLQNGRKSLRSDQWSEVAKKVYQASKTARSDAQCRNRLDTLKKKYKKEKTRMAETISSISKWVYFNQMDALMSSPSPPPSEARQPQPPRLRCGVDAGEYVFASSKLHLNRSNDVDEMRDIPGDIGSEDDESDGLPPGKEKVSGGSETSFRILAESIQKLGEIYEKIESTKRQQMNDLERMRKEFHRDLEVQKRQILERAQVDIAKMRQEEGEEEEEEDERTEEDDDDGDAENDVST